jgi:hypothetical protein
LVLFFRKEPESSFSEEKEAKRLLLSGRSGLEFFVPIFEKVLFPFLA